MNSTDKKFVNYVTKWRKSDEVGVSDNSELLTAEAGLILSQFLLFMQQEGVWPCYQFIGDDPQPLTVEELNALKDEFKEMLQGS
jgi:hypothetical protein